MPPAILAITDSPELGRMLGIGLPIFGFKTTIVCTEVSLISAEMRTPDAILLEIPWNTHEGFELCERLRCLPHIGDTPILCMTTDIRPDRWVDVLLHGGDDLILLPIAFPLLAERIRFHITQIQWCARRHEEQFAEMKAG